MKLQTIVQIPPAPWQISYDDRLLFLGSCFSDAISEQLAMRSFRLTANPFGTLYNPLSIAQAFYTLACPKLVEYNGLWHSMAHHGSFSRPTKEETEQAVSGSIERMQEALRDASVIIVTFGSAWVYEWALTEQRERSINLLSNIVANCHKMPESWFVRRRLAVEEIVAAWQPLLSRYADKHWIFTVSPIRHVKDGLHENQLSKATLLMAINRLIAQHSELCQHGGQNPVSAAVYFPSYEIVLDELRDYRFYASDLVHLNETGVQYVYERFVESFFSSGTREEMDALYRYYLQSQHRLLHPESDESRQFLQRLAARREQLLKRYPWI